MDAYLLLGQLVKPKIQQTFRGWRYIFKSRNGKEMSVATGFYSRKQDCKRAWNRMLRSSEYV